MHETGSPVKLRYIQAVNAALRWALETYPEFVILGEDVALPGGPFGATKGLHELHPERVLDTPISEAAFVGAALGAAMQGMRPLVEIMYMDFVQVAMDQIVNQIANTRYVSEGRWRAPLTIRTQQGYSPGACAQHSQSLEAWFAHAPGLRVGLPTTAADAYAMLRAAIAADDPVLVIESRLLYASKSMVDLDAPLEQIGGARVVREGCDVTVVTWSRMVAEVLTAADIVRHSAEVIDLRWLSPLDFATVSASIQKTGRLVVAHEANTTGGFGAEVAARAAAECFDALTAPVLRVGAPDVRIPASPHLQQVLLPSAGRIADAINHACESRRPTVSQLG